MKIFIFIILSVFPFFQDLYTFKSRIRTEKSDFVAVDELENIYIISGSRIIKYNPEGKILATFSDLKSGNPSQMDASNPMKMLVLYPQFSMAYVLDKNLTVKSRIHFPEMGIKQPVALCLGYNDGLWVFDQSDLRLKRLGPNLKVEFEIPFSTFMKDSIAPTLIREQGNYIYIKNAEKGILILDLYGNYIKTIEIRGIKAFQVLDGKLLYLKKTHESTELWSYDTRFNKESKILLPDKESVIDLLDARILRQKLFLFKKEMIDLYSF